MSSSTPAPAPATTSTKPSRHISHLTQMAANALGRDVPGMAKVKIRRPGDPPLQRKSHDEWDDIGEYKTKASWKAKGWEVGLGQVEQVQSMQALKVAPLDRRWAHSWDRDPMAK
jgi:dynactin-4